MPRKLPERFLPPDGESFCQECDKIRCLCRLCDRCSEHCECADTCKICGGYIGSGSGIPYNGSLCTCYECCICYDMVGADDADFGYGLSEEQASENSGTTATVVCPRCVSARRTPPSPSERGWE